MTTIVKIHRKGQMTLPTKLRRLAGITEGDLVQATFHQGKIVITPALVVDRSKFSAADGEYTPAQRKIIDAQLATAEKGPFYGPFNGADELIAHLQSKLKKRGPVKKAKRSR